MATSAQPEVSRTDAEHFVQKLQAFREGLPDGEKRVLDGTLRVLQDRVNDPSVRDLLADFPDGPELLNDVAGFAKPVGDEQDMVITVTVTTVTVVRTY